MTECPTFEEFYRTVNDREPFPWQSRLAEQVAHSGWPALIGIPTGLGKSSCLDIAVWVLATQAYLPARERTAPTRLWWVVNRRLLVDHTYEHAEKLARSLQKAKTGPLHAVADHLRMLGGETPLQTIRLRGGVGGDRPTSPVQPAVICSTIPMYGSRLLFRGYGSSRSTRPIDAALAYTDSLVICDEAHLAPHLVELISQTADLDSGTAGPILPGGRHHPKIVALTATGDAGVERFDLDNQDRRHPLISKRIETPKPVRIAKHNPTRNVANLIAAEVVELMAGKTSSSCLVFVNTPATARTVVQRLNMVRMRKQLGHPEVVMLTGRMREREAETARRAVLEGMSAGGPPTERERTLIVVATQTLEVGADLDAQFMVTEACGVRALTQRLGRVNRLGKHSETRGVYVHVPPPSRKGDEPRWVVYGTEPTRVLEHLEAADDGSGIVDLSPAQLEGDILGHPLEDTGRSPVLSMPLLREWAQTTAETPGEAPVDPFFNGIVDPRWTVQVLWRAHLPDDGERVWPAPNDREAIELPLTKVQAALTGLADRTRWVIDGVARSVAADSEGIPELVPRRTLILESSIGKMDKNGWNPEADLPVVDMSILSHGLPLSMRAIRNLYPESDPPFDPEDVTIAAGYREGGEPVDPGDRADAAHRLIKSLANRSPAGYEPDEWNDLVQDLRLVPRSGRNEVSRLQRRTPAGQVRFEVFDELSTTGNTGLDQHGEETAELAGEYARKIGIDGQTAQVVEKGARLHDIGKADPRFQKWLYGDDPPNGLLAKSHTPRHLWQRHRAQAGWPKGGRHEAISGRLVAAWLETEASSPAHDQNDLLTHLVMAHHGQGRPMIRPVSDSTGVGLTVTIPIDGDEVTVNAALTVVDWDQPWRFATLNSRYGHWGLALLETIVRQADWIASGPKVEVR